MNKSVQKKQSAGWELRIKRVDTWERVGFVFNSKHEAYEFKEKRYPEVKTFTVTGIRLDVTPAAGRRDERTGNEVK